MKSQPQAVDVMEMVYKNKLYNGFYVEAGAADCEFSVSLPLEYNYNWTGVLIEANSKWFDRCLKKKRKSYLLHNCIGTQKRAHFAEFNFVSTGTTKDNGTTMGGFNGADNHKGEVFQVQCFNLESILNAVGQPTVNLFVLDIEGFELAVLKSINWEKVNIEVLSIETIHAGIMMKDSSLEIIIDFLKDKGYTRFRHRNDLKNDLFVRNDIVDKYNVVQL